MTFCSKMHDIHNRDTTLALDVISLPSRTQKPLTISEGGDAMDLLVINSRGGGNCRGRGGGRGGGWEGHRGEGNKTEASNAKAKRSRNRTSPTPTET